MKKKSILILSYSNLNSDPRVKRQVLALKDSFHITIIAYTPLEDDEIIFYPIYTLPCFSLPRKLKRFFQLITRKFDLFYWDDYKKKLKENLEKEKFDVIIANDIYTLPLALAIANNDTKVYFDAHEYHPKEWEDNWKWYLLNKKYIEFLCKTYIPMASAFSSVCESIATEYEKFSGIKPFVITNASNYHDLHPSEIDENKIRIIHHGAAIPSRKIETMIEVIKHLDKKFSLDLMLTGDISYINHLKNLSSNFSQINFIRPVPQEQICKKLNQYDVGLYILQPSNFNNLYALPNKIFEFVQARLCITVSPNPEMAQLVQKYNLGIVSEDFSPEAMANEIKKLTKEKIFYYKQQSHFNAKDLSAEKSIHAIREIVNKLISE